jgi:hypothetical protein
LAFAHTIEPMPPNPLTPEGQGRRMRLVAVTFRLQDTPCLRADLGRGPVETPLRRLAGPQTGGLLLGGSEQPAPAFTGERRFAALGWAIDQTRALWRIDDDRPLPFTLLSAAHDIKVNV